MEHRFRIARPRAGFTLIELLVVIAIIAILAAILFPVFAQAREKARQIACLSNKKQIGIAIMQYVQDFDEVYPANNWTYGDNNSMGFQCGWMSEIQPYLKNTQVYECPDASVHTVGTIPAPGGATTGPGILVVPTHQIGANEWVVSSITSHASGGNGISQSGKGNISEAMVGKPAELPVVADSTFSTFNDGTRVMNANWTGSFSAAPTAPDPSLARHTTGSSIVYADGHAHWVAQASMAWQPTLKQEDGVTPCGTSPARDHPGETCWGIPLNPKKDPRLM